MISFLNADGLAALPDAQLLLRLRTLKRQRIEIQAAREAIASGGHRRPDSALKLADEADRLRQEHEAVQDEARRRLDARHDIRGDIALTTARRSV